MATWYEDARHHPDGGLYAAAGPALRHGDWRGSLVRVCFDGSENRRAEGCATVRLTDWCACGRRHGAATLLDLSPDAFRAVADPTWYPGKPDATDPLTRGVVLVRIVAAIALPATDTIEGEDTPR